MRTMLACGLIVVLAGAGHTAGGEKIDPAKLVGTWSGGKGKGTLEFTKDGKAITIAEVKGKEIKGVGDYKVEGDKLTVVYKTGDKQRETEHTITKLTDDELVLVTGKTKKTDKLKRVR